MELELDVSHYMLVPFSEQVAEIQLVGGLSKGEIFDICYPPSHPNVACIDRISELLHIVSLLSMDLNRAQIKEFLTHAREGLFSKTPLQVLKNGNFEAVIEELDKVVIGECFN